MGPGKANRGRDRPRQINRAKHMPSSSITAQVISAIYNGSNGNLVRASSTTPTILNITRFMETIVFFAV
jgi:hypothetical protein